GDGRRDPRLGPGRNAGRAGGIHDLDQRDVRLHADPPALGAGHTDVQPPDPPPRAGARHAHRRRRRRRRDRRPDAPHPQRGAVTISTFKHLFSWQAGDYARFRPTYPAALYDWLATLPAERRLAVDVGTGNGQAAIELATRFERVIGVDPSEAQLANA